MCAFIFCLLFVVPSIGSHSSHNTINDNCVHTTANNSTQPPRTRAKNQASTHTYDVGGSKSRQSWIGVQGRKILTRMRLTTKEKGGAPTFPQREVKHLLYLNHSYIY